MRALDASLAVFSAQAMLAPPWQYQPISQGEQSPPLTPKNPKSQKHDSIETLCGGEEEFRGHLVQDDAAAGE